MKPFNYHLLIIKLIERTNSSLVSHFDLCEDKVLLLSVPPLSFSFQKNLLSNLQYNFCADLEAQLEMRSHF